MLGFESNQYVNVAVGAEFISQHGAEQRQLLYFPAFAEDTDCVKGYIDMWSTHTLHCLVRIDVQSGRLQLLDKLHLPTARIVQWNLEHSIIV